MISENEERTNILQALCDMLISSRCEAIAFRASSGIESEWIGDEEFYQGYNDANRHEFSNHISSKPGENSGLIDIPKKATGSTVFPNITQSYVDAAAARVGDMLLPTDDRNFVIEETPIPDMGGLGGHTEDAPTQMQQGMVQMPGGQPMPAQEAQAAFDQLKVEAKRKANKAQNEIDDWLVECQYHDQMRLVIDDCAKLGTGVIKGPVPVNRTAKKWQQNEMGVRQLTLLKEIKPASFRIDVWNLFPDGACGENIHNGSFIWERDFITEKKLRDLVGLPGYLEDQIEKCIEESAGGRIEADGKPNQNGQKKSQFTIWYYHGIIKIKDLLAAGCECEEGKDSYPAMITMVNDRVIRASLNPIDSGDFPYDVIPWKRRPDMPWGMGVARQIRTPQRMVVAATRNMMDNAGLASGPQLVIRRGVEPENGVWEIVPRKMWKESDESDGQSGAPFIAVTIPMLQVELNNIIQLGMKFAEDCTGLPMIMQGQQGKAPDTVGGMTILNNNANAVLRRIARLFDSCITEPHVRRYYDWLMEYGEDDDSKGDFQVVARGSSALVERDIQSQEMVNIIQMSLNPAFGLNPKRSIKEYLKSRRFDPAAFEYTKEEMRQMAQQQQPPMPQVQVAQIREQGATQRKQMELGATAQENNLDRQLEKMKIEVDAQLGAANLSAEERSALNDAKVTLAGLSMKLNVQKILSDQNVHHQKDIAVGAHAADLYKHNSQAITPPTEPVGRADNGQAFVQ